MDSLLGIEIFSSSYECHGLSLTSARAQQNAFPIYESFVRRSHEHKLHSCHEWRVIMGKFYVPLLQLLTKTEKQVRTVKHDFSIL
jgi:hypothetical protein